MRVIVAEKAGFCMGVRNALDKALAAAESSSGEVYTLGPLIHNERVVQTLERRGVRCRKDLAGVTHGKVVIRAHGTTREKRAELESRGLEVVEGTCPHVLRSQRLAAEWSGKGYFVVIAGDKDHAEVVGLMGHCTNGCAVVSHAAEVDGLRLPEKVCIIAQTTFNESLLGEIASRVKLLRPEAQVLPTICRATAERQEEVVRLSREVEAVVVVGDKGSANTRRLAEVASATGKPTFLVEGAEDLDAEALSRYSVVGVTAGASTPSWVIQSVVEQLEAIGRQGVRWWVRNLLAVLVRSSVCTALGAAALCYCCCLLLGYKLLPWQTEGPIDEYMTIAFSYIFTVYAMNRLREAGRGERYTARLHFSARHKIALTIGSCLLFALSGYVSWGLGRRVHLLLFAAYVMGLIYSLEVIPRLLRIRYRKLRDIPASKDVFTAAGWTTVCVLIPYAREPGSLAGAIVAVLLALVVNFVRATIFDLTDIQGDRILGRETLPVLLGARATRRLLLVLTGVLLVALVAFGASGVLGENSGLALLLALCPIYLYLYLRMGQQWSARSELRCSLFADASLFLCGGIALVWALVS